MKNNKNKSIKDLLVEYFKSHPKEDMSHGPVVDWVEEKYKKLYHKKPRDTWRSIRNLHEIGFLIKVKKGIYRYDPKVVKQRELQVDHIKSKYEGGKAIIENGETLCSQHNFIKKHLNQTETGKKMFIRLYELAKYENNKGLIDFCTDVLNDYEKHNINGHIIWKK